MKVAGDAMRAGPVKEKEMQEGKEKASAEPGAAEVDGGRVEGAQRTAPDRRGVYIPRPGNGSRSASRRSLLRTTIPHQTHLLLASFSLTPTAGEQRVTTARSGISGFPAWAGMCAKTSRGTKRFSISGQILPHGHICPWSAVTPMRSRPSFPNHLAVMTVQNCMHSDCLCTQAP
jgi:hypothetical protein